MSDVGVTAVGTLICFAPLPAHCSSPYTQAEGSRANELLALSQQQDPPLHPCNHHPTSGTEQPPALNPPLGVPMLCHPQHAAGLPLLPANPFCRLERGSGVGSVRAERRRRGAEAGRSSSQLSVRGHAPYRVAPPPAPPRRRGQPGSVARRAGSSAVLRWALRSAMPPARRLLLLFLLLLLPLHRRWALAAAGTGLEGSGSAGRSCFLGRGEGRTFGCAGKSSLPFGWLSAAASWPRVSVRVSCWSALGWGASDPHSCTPRRERGGRGFLHSYQTILFSSVIPSSYSISSCFFLAIHKNQTGPVPVHDTAGCRVPPGQTGSPSGRV